jgi:hypothetical protein
MNNLTKKMWRAGSRDAFHRRGVANRINLLRPLAREGMHCRPELGDSFSQSYETEVRMDCLEVAEEVNVAALNGSPMEEK